MKPLSAFLILSFSSCVALADDAAKNILVPAGKVVTEPSLKEPLDDTWAVSKGTWEVKDGEMVAAEVPEQKHAAVLWHKVGLSSAVIDCDFYFDGAKVFIIGCDGTKHIGRLVMTYGSIKICEDSSEVKGVRPGATLAEAKVNLKPGEWHHAHLKWTGDQMAARVDGVEIKGNHPTLSAPKSRWWLAVGGSKAKVKNVKASTSGTP